MEVIFVFTALLALGCVLFCVFYVAGPPIRQWWTEWGRSRFHHPVSATILGVLGWVPYLIFLSQQKKLPGLDALVGFVMSVGWGILWCGAGSFICFQRRLTTPLNCWWVAAMLLNFGYLIYPAAFWIVVFTYAFLTN
jgi:hypothetical protein